MSVRRRVSNNEEAQAETVTHEFYRTKQEIHTPRTLSALNG